jgi:HK97 gp10 family phage protein
MAKSARSTVFVDTRSLDEIIKTLEKLDDLTQKQVSAAAKAGAKFVQGKAKEKAPVSQDGSNGKPRGFLKKNIRIKAEKSKTKGKKVYSIGIAGSAFYGVFLEYGTKKIAARPFLRPALENHTETVRKVVLSEIAKGVDKVK